MKRFLFALAAVALAASVANAEEKPGLAPASATPGKLITTTDGTSNTILVGETTVAPVAGPAVTYAPAQPQTQRRGLFARLRNRNNNTTYYSSPAPQMVAPFPAATPMPPITPPQPMPMPGVKPISGMVIPATGNLPPGQYTTTDGTIVQIGGPAMAAPVMTAGYTEPTSTRRGLFSRMRTR